MRVLKGLLLGSILLILNTSCSDMDKVMKATIFKFNDHYMVHSTNTTSIGYGIASKPYIRLDKDATYVELAESLITALKASKSNVKAPGRDFKEEYLDAMGLKTFNDLHNNSFQCFVYVKNDVITFIPTRNEGSRNGFKHLPGKQMEITFNANAEKISDALKEALSRCE